MAFSNCDVYISFEHFFCEPQNDVLLSISAAKGTARKLTVQELVTTVHGSGSCDLVMEGNNDWGNFCVQFTC